MRSKPRCLALVLLTLLGLGLPTGAGAQPAPSPLLARLRAVGVDSVVRGVTVYFSPGARERADVLGPMVAEAVEFFRDSLGVTPDLRLALVDEAGWGRVSQYPYGLPHVAWDAGAPIAVLPARPGGVVYDDFVSLAAGASPELRARVRAAGLSWEEAVGRMIDMIGFHEIGHAYARAYGIGRPAHWFNEFLASYFAFAYMSARRPELAELWEVLGRAKTEGYQPRHRSLEEFERLYAGVGVEDYGWYQSVFEARANPLVREQGLTFVRRVRELFPEGTERLPYAEVLRRLESIAPGFQRWAQVFEGGETGH